MRIAICDDFEPDALKLKEVLGAHPKTKDFEPDLFSNGAELLDAFGKEPFDLVFLDVALNEAENGIALAKKLRVLSSESCIVFVTNYPEYALEAFDVAAFHYLVKPFDDNKINTVIGCAVENYLKRHASYTVKTKSGYMNLPVFDIYYVEHYNKRLTYHFGNSSVEAPGKLSDAYDFLRAYDFCQIHKGYIVNMRKIINIDRESVYFDNGTSLPFSTRRKAAIMSEYVEYLKGEVK